MLVLEDVTKYWCIICRSYFYPFINPDGKHMPKLHKLILLPSRNQKLNCNNPCFYISKHLLIILVEPFTILYSFIIALGLPFFAIHNSAEVFFLVLDPGSHGLCFSFDLKFVYTITILATYSNRSKAVLKRTGIILYHPLEFPIHCYT